MRGRDRSLPSLAIFLPLALSLFSSAASIFAADVNSLPKPTGYLSDFANVVNPTDKARLETLCTEVEQQLAVQFALVTVDTVGDRPVRDFALDLSRKWGVGDRKSNQGVLLLLVIKDHKSDIETGRGIEPYITDGFAGSTLRDMRPQLRGADYGAALITAAQSMAAQIAQGKGLAFSDDSAVARRTRRPTERHGVGIPGPLLLIGLVFLLWLFGRGGRGRRGGGGGGFFPGFLIGSMLGGPRSGGGGWGGGGFGGDSGGGGGFGGFGGGDFGGGGASSDW